MLLSNITSARAYSTDGDMLIASSDNSKVFALLDWTIQNCKLNLLKVLVHVACEFFQCDSVYS